MLSVSCFSLAMHTVRQAGRGRTLLHKYNTVGYTHRTVPHRTAPFVSVCVCVHIHLCMTGGKGSLGGVGG